MAIELAQPTLVERIDAAIQRIVDGNACMRIPADPADPDLVLADCKRALVRAEAERDAWRDLYRRAVDEANGLTNYVEDRPELRGAEKRLDKIQTEARGLAA